MSRKKLYSELEELQVDFDEWLKHNYERPHSGKYCYGKTPYQTFLESKYIANEKTIDENNKTNDMKKEFLIV